MLQILKHILIKIFYLKPSGVFVTLVTLRSNVSNEVMLVTLLSDVST